MDSSDNPDVKIPQKDQKKKTPLNLGPDESPRKRGSRFEKTSITRSWTTGGGVKTPRRSDHGHK